MSRRIVVFVASAILLTTCYLSPRVEAGELWTRIKARRYQPAPIDVSPTPDRYADFRAAMPGYDSLIGVPTYNWGYFGARSRVSDTVHRGYYGDVSQWHYRRN